MRVKVLIASVALIAMLAGGLALWRSKRTQDGPPKENESAVIFDAAKTREAAERLMPGVKPPAGYQWVATQTREKVKMESATLARSQDEASYNKLSPDGLRFIFVGLDIPPKIAPEQRLDEFSNMVFLARQNRGWKLISKIPESLKVKGKQRPAVKLVLKTPDGKSTLLEHHLLFINGTRMVLLIINGPKATFNAAAMQKFLDGLTLPEQQKKKK